MTAAVLRPPSGRRLGVFVALVIVAVVVGYALLGGGGRGSLTSSASPNPSGGQLALAPDLAPRAVDGRISESDLAHDSRSDLYRTPFGAVPAGTKVTLRIRAAAGDLSDATVRVWDSLATVQVLVPMHVATTDRVGGTHGYDYWEASLQTLARPTVLYYRFIVRDGATTRYLEDDLPADGGSNEANDGGPGQVYAESPDSSWQIVAYRPDFATPEWTRGAVVYQIFPDRFFNGDPANDPRPSDRPTGDGAGRYRRGDVYGNPIVIKSWDELPEGYCRAYQGVSCDEGPLGRDFFGGDLAGVTAKLDDLADLGVTAIYLNPIFAAPSNHRYDTEDYRQIDPGLGSQADFDALLAAAKEQGIRVILDGVFNHVSSASPYFDRERRYDEVGACESADSPYRAWFAFRRPDANEPSPCASSTPDGDDTYYVGWFGFDTIPELVEQPDVNRLFYGPDGVAQYWLSQGTAGWRLDVMDNLSHGFMKGLRVAIKSTDPEALVLGEQWGDTSPWLLGNEADSTMNYRFRRAVIGFLNGATADLDGSIAALRPSQFASRMAGVMEDYPAPAFDALLNLVDGHDTTRILWTLTPGAENAAAKADPESLARGKEKLRQLATLQLTWPGMASIYYGDEVGLSGQDDPDDRRPYPWGARDESLRDHYRTLARLRAEHVALREGDLRFLLADDDARTLAFGRRTDDEAAITVLNVSATPTTIRVPVADYIPDGATMTSALSGESVTIAHGSFAVTIPGRGSALLITAPGTDLAPPASPGEPVATATSGSVGLSWPAVEGAAGYRILRSIVSGGGYEAVGASDTPSFTDSTARNGVTYRYVVVALDAAGNVGPRSAEAVALPRLTLSDARLEGPEAIEQPLSAVDPGTPIAARVRVDGVTGGATPTVGILAQLGLGPAGSDPAAGTPDDAGWRWTPTAWAAGVDGADRLVGTVRPEEPGAYEVALRVSTDGGATWAYAGRSGVTDPFDPAAAVKLTAVRGTDTSPPPAPGAPSVAVVSEAALTLVWPPVTAPDLLRYRILRSETRGGPYEQVGVAVEPTFTDDGVVSGTTYHYVVTAEDVSFNRSAESPEVASAAQSREVAVTFRVTLPPQTPPDATIFIAGDFQGWNPGKTPMTRVDATTWEISVPFTEGAAPQYKYTRGSWEAVEKDAGCGEIPNRTFVVQYGADGTTVVEDDVAKWRDIDGCG